MRKLNNFRGVTGQISFDNKGDLVKAKYFVLQFDKRSYPGKWVKVIEQQPFTLRSHNWSNHPSHVDAVTYGARFLYLILHEK